VEVEKPLLLSTSVDFGSSEETTKHIEQASGSLCADSNAIPCVLSTDNSQGSRTTDEA